MTDTSINLTDVNAHLASSQRITDTLEPAIDDIVREERAVIAASGGYAPAETAVNLPQITDAWRANDAKLRTIHDVLIANGAAGTVTGLDTHSLRDDVADANGVDNRGTFEIRDDGLDYIIDGQGGDDTIDVTQRADGTALVRINGRTVILDAEETQRLLIDGGDGDDIITVNPHTPPRIAGPGGSRPDPDAPTLGFRINGGADNDTILGGTGADQIDAGVGRDYVDGGAGNDHVWGGDGFDTIYGGDGNDRLRGEGNNDYIDGGEGTDYVWGQGGDDFVAGGHGNDYLYGGTGDDHHVGGPGADFVQDTGLGDNDRVYADAADTVRVDANAEEVPIEAYETTTVTIDPAADDRFRDRVEADLVTLGAMPAGASVLTSIDTNTNGKTVTIAETSGGNTADWSKRGTADSNDRRDPTVGDDATVNYNTTRTDTGARETFSERPPVIGLGHELIHADDFVTGTTAASGDFPHMQTDANGDPLLDAGGNQVPVVDSAGNPVADAPNLELQAIGAPYDQDGDGVVDRNDSPHTEAAFRDEFNQVERPFY